MDFGKAFSFVFEDEDWVPKVLLGALISLIPIVGQFLLLGWGIAVLRNVKEGRPRPLPSWDEFGEHLSRGFKYWVVTLVYAIPILIVLCPVAVVVIPVSVSAAEREAPLVLSTIAGVVAAGAACLVAAYGVFLALLTPALQVRFAETDEIGPCLRIGEVFGILRENFGRIFVALLVATLAGGVVVSVLGSVTLGLLALPASVWLTAMSSHLYAQATSSSHGAEGAGSPAAVEKTMGEADVDTWEVVDPADE